MAFYSNRGSVPSKYSAHYTGNAPKVDKRFKVASNVDLWINSKTWARVRSSNVSEVMYDRGMKRLYVRFKRGGEYFYTGITIHRAKEFFRTGSFGHEVWELRWAGHPGYKVTGGRRGRRVHRAHR